MLFSALHRDAHLGLSDLRPQSSLKVKHNPSPPPNWKLIYQCFGVFLFVFLKRTVTPKTEGSRWCISPHPPSFTVSQHSCWDCPVVAKMPTSPAESQEVHGQLGSLPAIGRLQTHSHVPAAGMASHRTFCCISAAPSLSLICYFLSQVWFAVGVTVSTFAVWFSLSTVLNATAKWTGVSSSL